MQLIKAVVAAVLVFPLVAACQPASPGPAPDKIRVGYAISLSGPYEPARARKPRLSIGRSMTP